LYDRHILEFERDPWTLFEGADKTGEEQKEFYDGYVGGCRQCKSAVGRRLDARGTTGADMCKPDFQVGLKSGAQDPPLACSADVERGHALMYAAMKLTRGKRKGPKPAINSHFVLRHRGLVRATMGKRGRPEGVKRVRRANFARVLKLAQRNLRPKKQSSAHGGLRLKTWYVNSRLRRERLTFGKRSRREFLESRHRWLLTFEALNPAQLQGVLREFHQAQTEKGAVVKMDPSQPVPWSPFGASSYQWPLAESKLDAHIKKLSTALGGSGGVQHLAAELPAYRERLRDHSSTTAPVLQPQTVRELSSGLNDKAMKRFRKEGRTCFDLHKGLCSRRDAFGLPQALVMHDKLQDPMQHVCKHHKAEGLVMLAFVAVEGNDQPIGISGKALRFASLTKWDMKRKRGCFSLLEKVRTTALDDLPLQIRVSVTAGEIGVATSHQFAKMLSDLSDDEWKWWAIELDCRDDSLQVSFI